MPFSRSVRLANKIAPAQVPRPRTLPKGSSSAPLLNPPKSSLDKAQIKSLILSQYANPTVQDMAIIMAYFNPIRSIRIHQNLLLISQKLEASKIPFYIVELAYEQQPFLLEASHNIIRLRSDTYMFYKELMVSIAIERLPTQFTKICLLDADVVFDDPAWYDVVSHRLEDLDVCQCFERTFLLNNTLSEPERSYECFMKRGYPGGHPGFVWAFKRTIAKQLIPESLSLIGSGDTIIAREGICSFAFHKDSAEKYVAQLPKLKRGYLYDMDIYHLFHGDFNKRQYVSRYTIVAEYLNSIGVTLLSEILVKNADGLYEIIPKYRVGFNNVMLKMFKQRDDDGI